LIFEDIGPLEQIVKVIKENIIKVDDNLKKYVLNGLIDQIELTLGALKKKQN